MLYFFRLLIILLKGIIPRFAFVISMVWLVSAVSFRSFRWFRFGGFVSLVSVVSFRWFRFVVSGFSTCLVKPSHFPCKKEKHLYTRYFLIRKLKFYFIIFRYFAIFVLLNRRLRGFHTCKLCPEVSCLRYPKLSHCRHF